MKTETIGVWIDCTSYQSIRGHHCEITLEPRPPYCDRGRFLAKLFPDKGSKLAMDIDGSDGWPRYYFDEAAAKSECEAWLKFRKEL